VGKESRIQGYLKRGWQGGWRPEEENPTIETQKRTFGFFSLSPGKKVVEGGTMSKPIPRYDRLGVDGLVA